MFVFMDNVQYTAVNDKEIELFLKSIDICRQWIPIILEGQRRGEFRGKHFCYACRYDWTIYIFSPISL